MSQASSASKTADADRGLAAEFRPRFLLYSHDGFGLGHFRRNLVIARAITAASPDASVLLACAAEGIETFRLPPGVDVLRLPGVRKVANGRYVARRLHIDDETLLSIRSGVLAAAVAEFRPDVLLADKHPLGVRGELRAALDRLRLQGGRAALGLRDVLDDGPATNAEWRLSGLSRQVEELYDLALVYGSLTILDPLADNLLPVEFEPFVRCCGYVVADAPATRESDRPPFDDVGPTVLAMAGGGEDGLPLLETFVEAAVGRHWRGVVIAGPQMEQRDWRRLQRMAAAAGVAAHESVRQVQGWYQHAAVLVCMGGYNTLMEALAAPIPTICVPRTEPRREQLIRARAFAAEGLIQVVEPNQLTPSALADAIERSLAMSRSDLANRVSATLDLDGAARAAGHLLDLSNRSRAAMASSQLATPA